LAASSDQIDLEESVVARGYDVMSEAVLLSLLGAVVGHVPAAKNARAVADQFKAQLATASCP